MVELPKKILNFKLKIYPEVIPNLNYKELNQKLSEISKEYQKEKVIVFLVIDYEFKLIIPSNIFVLRTSLRKSLWQTGKEYVLPYIWETIEEPFDPLPRTNFPIVGFCGQVNKYRKNILNFIHLNKQIKDNFILNKYFWGGIYNDNNDDKADINILINNFRNNMRDSHFIICNRGAGNFTMRFYQTLAAGRIPVLVDTDMLLPLCDKINWSDFIIIENSEDKVISKILIWWKYKNIELAQIKCFQIFHKYFSHLNFENYLNTIF